MTDIAPESITRRGLLARTGLAALGAASRSGSMPRLAFRPAGTPRSDDVLVVVFARGGYDGLNVIVPYGNESDYFRRRPNIGIPAPDSSATRRAGDLDGFFGLHPALVEAGWKTWYDARIYAPVHAMHMDDPTRSHFAAMDYMERGTPGRQSPPTGWIGRHLDTLTSPEPSPFRAVGVGTMLQASLRGPVPAVVLPSIADFRLQGRPLEIARLQEHLGQLYGGDDWLDRQGQATVAALDLLAAHTGTGPYRPANGAVYPSSTFGRAVMQIAQLLRAEVGLAVACVDIGSWDTHANETSADDATTGALAELLDDLGRSMTAFVTDLREEFDPADRSRPGITVAVMSEFGRRANENGSFGTDHGHGNVMHLFGKGILGGTVYTNPWPGLADDQLDERGDLVGTIEYRDILGEIVERRLGNTAVNQVFPDHRFAYLGLAHAVEGAGGTPTPGTPSPAPTATAATATPGATPADANRAYLPWARPGR
jgi:uncharacterized protein (DUF1501 family)